MIAPLAPTYRWREGGVEVTARPCGMIALHRGGRVVLIDAADRHYVGEVDCHGQLTAIVAGPVTGAQALEAAERVIAGIDHGSVSQALSALAIGLVVATVARPS